MESSVQTSIVSSPEELGNIARSVRRETGESIRALSAKHHIGVRFLSEFERGKPTAEIGKAMAALNAVGLDLAVVPKRPPEQKVDRLSVKLGLEVPYDWSNPNINESIFIRLVLSRTRFNDILRIAHHFGIERVESEAELMMALPQYPLIEKLLSRIQIGISRATKQS